MLPSGGTAAATGWYPLFLTTFPKTIYFVQITPPQTRRTPQGAEPPGMEYPAQNLYCVLAARGDLLSGVCTRRRGGSVAYVSSTTHSKSIAVPAARAGVGSGKLGF